MPMIYPEGLFNGDRLAAVSDNAKLHFCFMFAASNGFGRLELNYRKIVATAYARFSAPPSEEELAELIQEYVDKHLLFLYSAGGALWGAWDTKSKQKYYTNEDKASPAPPQEAFDSWKKEYEDSKAESIQALGAFSKLYDTFAKKLAHNSPNPVALSANHLANPSPELPQDSSKISSCVVLSCVEKRCVEESVVELNGDDGARAEQPDIAADPFPETTAAVQAVFPEADEIIVEKIALACWRESPDATDADIALAVCKTRKRGQNGPALWVTTAPAWLKTMKRKAPVSIAGPPRCRICNDEGLVYRQGIQTQEKWYDLPEEQLKEPCPECQNRKKGAA